MLFNERKVIVISGGSKGLGEGLVAKCLEHRHAIATFSRNSTEFIDEIRQNPANDDSFFWQSVDGQDPVQVQAFIKSVIKRFDRIDVLINNVGMGIDGVFSLMRAEDIQRALGVNLECPIHLTHACSRVMLSQGSGAIINISSVNALRGHAGVAVYSATKAALDGLTRSLARELGPRGVRVNSVAPGYFESDMVEPLTDTQRHRIIRRTPLGRLGKIEDIVSVVEFLVSPAAQFVTGQTIVVDGGITC